MLLINALVRTLAIAAVGLLMISCSHNRPADSEPSAANGIQHIVVIYLENHSFYNLFSDFPGADNALPKDYAGQVDEQGKPYAFLPPVPGDKRFPARLPNQPFLIDQYSKIDEKTRDLGHEFYEDIAEIDGGRMDRFAALSGAGALAMGRYDMRHSALWKFASEFTLADHFYQSAFGGSFLNHQYLVAARTPRWDSAPQSVRITLDHAGLPEKPRAVTPDGYAVNTIQPRLFPYYSRSLPADRLPPIEDKNIGDLMTGAGVTWAYYAGGWNRILNHEHAKGFEYHHQPFIYFKNYGPGTQGRAEHLKDEEDFMAALKEHRLPQVVFFKPIGDEDAHPGYSTVDSGDVKTKAVVDAVRSGGYWDDTLIIVTFDESGGYWDPVPPPRIDSFGPGPRIPAVFISPRVKSGAIDHSVYETDSILAFIEKRFHLPALSARDAKADPLSGIFKGQ